MSKLFIEAKRNSPEIDFDNISGIYTIKGNSFQEDSTQFYNNILDWVSQNNFPKKTKFIFTLDYISSRSVANLYQLVEKIAEHKKNGGEVEIIWEYEEDEDNILGVGEKFQTLSNLPFKFKEIAPE